MLGNQTYLAHSYYGKKKLKGKIYEIIREVSRTKHITRLSY